MIMYVEGAVNNGGTIEDNGFFLLPGTLARESEFFQKDLRGSAWLGCNRLLRVATVSIS